MADTPSGFDYKRYLASREWSLLREQVRERSGDSCEHCFVQHQQAVHHLTYERIGRERLEDLMAVCNPCHEYLSGKSNENPLTFWAVVSPPVYVTHVAWPRHLLLPYQVPPKWEWPGVPAHGVRCDGPSCLFCKYIDPDWPMFVMGLMLLVSP
jgi:hypothetical protein